MAVFVLDVLAAVSAGRPGRNRPGSGKTNATDKGMGGIPEEYALTAAAVPKQITASPRHGADVLP
jgi:hypothetical protein